MADILPCPFCGGPASVWGSWLYSTQGPFSGHVHCETYDCAHGPGGRGATVDEAGNAAVAAWNKREVPNNIPGVIALSDEEFDAITRPADEP